ncbi:MAG: LysM peptidoglycan-binding domain-containing protein, partial [Candidatus Polarisedimenticolia bacterium]
AVDRGAPPADPAAFEGEDGAADPRPVTAVLRGAEADTVLPAARETTPERAPAYGAGEAQRVRQQMEEAYEAGLEAFQAGRFDEARDHFDRAVEVVIGSDVNLNEHPGLKKAFDEIVRNIADMEADLFSRESEQETAANQSPLDTLKDITTHLPADEAERERQKIQQVVGKIDYDIPIVLNRPVLSYIEAFQTRLRGEFESGLKRSGRYLPMIKKIFREEGLPEDLAYMAHQESAFKTSAYSRARARGMWQFMSFTGRKYGLKRDLWVDERMDFEKATRSAAAYLKDLHARYDDWYLAMAAYNAGEGKIDRAIRRSGKKDYWHLTKTNFIRRETKYYVPAILASILIDKSPEDYGFDVEVDEELRWDTLTLDKATDLQVLADAAGATLEEIRTLNPELHGLVTPPNRSEYTVRVPRGRDAEVAAHLEALPSDKRVSWTLHEVRPGETFQHIARKHRVPVRALLDANPRYAGRRLRRGQILNVPLAEGTPEIALAKAVQNPTYEPGERVVHRVRKGENLQAIAYRYRTTVVNLKRWNRLRGSLIRPGQRLVAFYGEKGDGPPREDPSNAAVSVQGGRLEYKVQDGDTLESIARKFGTAVEALCQSNNLTPDAIVRPGDRVVVGGATEGGVSPLAPPPAEIGSAEAGDAALRHRVRPGDTLYGIAQRYGATVREVRVWNGLASNRIYPGQLLTIHQN